MQELLNRKIPGCENFLWREVLFLYRWQVFVFPDDEQYINLIRVCNKLQEIRNRIGLPIEVTSGLRPHYYNREIGGAKRSKHRTGEAIDFRVKKQNPNRTRELILPWLEELDLRMEDLPDSSWVHIDIGEVISRRYFKP